MRDEVIIFKGQYVRTLCNKEDFKMYAIKVDITQYPELELNQYGNIVICGDLFDLQYGINYEITVYREPYKYGYKVVNLTYERPHDEESVFAFLNEILTHRQAETLFNNYPDIIDRVKENRLDDVDLNKLKGIKEKTFEKIVKKITENYCLVDLVSEFKGYLSLSIIRKLYNEYKSVDKLKYKLSKDAYKCLCEISGIGFKKADGILLEIEKVSKENIANGEEPIVNFKEDLKTSLQRCKASLVYLLTENEENGHTQMNLADLRTECMDLVSECADKFTEALKDNVFYYNLDNMEVSLRSTYAKEYSICKTIINAIKNENIQWETDIEQYRTINGCNLSDEQISVLDKIKQHNVVILNGAGGCVDCDTEYFNGYEWKKISEYTEGERVLQYNEDGTANLVYPSNYIKNEADYLWHFETKYGLNQCLSDEHNCYYITSKGNLYSKKFKEVRENQETTGFKGKFITSFDYEGNGIDLSDDVIRLMVAIFADGSFITTRKPDITIRKVRFHLKKERKKERLKMLLEKNNIEYKESKSSAEGYTDFYFQAPFRCKHFPSEWYNCNKRQFQIIADEVMYWDGRYNTKNDFSTTNKQDADFIQFVYTSLGYRATISVNDRRNQIYPTCGKFYVRKSVEYTVRYTERNLISMCVDNRPNTKKTEINKYKTIDGYEYCFTVPSHMLVLRRDNKIFITGNCGKSFCLQSLLVMLKDLNKSYTLLAPTGKASKVISEYTNENAKTIHRGLGYVMGEGFTYNKENKLDYDVVIVDEFSMVDLKLMKSLVDAIDFNRTKLLMIGDNSQLPSVGCGNIFHDLIQSNIIPTATLTKVFRYGEGGLMKVATDVRLCQNYLEPNMKNKATTFGSNGDYTYIDVPDDKITDSIIDIYKSLLSNGKTVNDIQVLSSMNKGEYGTIILNNKLQKVANKNYGSQTKITIQNNNVEISYYIDDLVIQTSNNYKAIVVDEYGNEIFEPTDLMRENPLTAFIANGESGIIKEICTSFVIIDFDGILVKYDKAQLAEINLGYAINIYKSQGSSINTVILATPKAHTFMLNSNLIYVGLTRMKKRCFHLGNLNTVKSAIKRKANLSRNTFSQRLLTSMINGVEVDIPYPKVDNKNNYASI